MRHLLLNKNISEKINLMKQFKIINETNENFLCNNSRLLLEQKRLAEQIKSARATMHDYKWKNKNKNKILVEQLKAISETNKTFSWNIQN